MIVKKYLNKIKTKNIILLFTFFIVFSISAQNNDSILFPIPKSLEANITFWKKIYTEISLKQGVLHDKDYPLLIYKIIELPNENEFTTSRFIEHEKQNIINKIKNISEKPFEELSSDERYILDLIKKYAPYDSINKAAERIRFQRGQKERFKEGLERSTAYLDTIRSILRDYGLPQKLVYMPHVESSFDLNAYSRVGAAGIWQIMRFTGKKLLKIDYLVDERRDPIFSTHAAAKYLKFAYEQLKTWPLAITSYNHGINGIKKAIETVGTYDIEKIIQNYSSPSFQFSSKNFYACFLAACEIAEHPDYYFVNLNFSPKFKAKSFILPSFMQASVICRYLNISQETLMEYNPSLRPVVFNQHRHIPQGFEIRIPVECNIPHPEKILASVPDSLKSIKEEQIAYYTIQRGDNLISIASRFNVPLKELLQENNINHNSKIYAGQILRIPTSQKKEIALDLEEGKNVEQQLKESQLVLPSQIDISTKSESKDLKSKKEKVERTELLKTALVDDTLKHVVMHSADTLPSSSKKIKNLSDSVFDVSVYDLEVTLLPEGNIARIKVSVDETIGHYADWLGISASKIRQLNKIGPRSEIKINNSLLIPVTSGNLEKFTKARLEYHISIEEDFYSRYKVIELKPKTIKYGDALWNICSAEEQIPLWLLIKHNKDVDLFNLKPGMNILIPVISEKTEDDIYEEENNPKDIYPSFGDPKSKVNSKMINLCPY